VIVGVIYRARQRGLDVKQKGPTKPKTVRVETSVKEAKVEVRTPPILVLVPPEELTVYRLQNGQCKYPTHSSVDNEQLFCGKSTDRIYCAEHHKLCHVHREPLKIKQLSKLR